MFWKRQTGKKPEVDPTSLGNLLLNSGACTTYQLQEALAERARQEEQLLGETMVRLGFISRETLITHLNQQAYLRGKDRRQVLRLARVAATGTVALSGNLDTLNDLALQVVQKLK